MTAIRLQGDRHWVQVEVPSANGNTAFVNLDLNMVDYVSHVRTGSKNPPDQVSITYAGIMAPIVLQGPSAHWFYATWNDFISLADRDIQPQMPPSVIHRVGGGAGVINMK